MYSDSHSHVDGYTDEQMAAVLAEAKAKGVETIIGVGTTLDTSEEGIQMARRFPAIVPTVGIHPWWAEAKDLNEGGRLKQLASQKEVAAIGEVGIDLEKNPDTADIQWGVFQMQLSLARETGLPMLLHCRGARDRMQEMLRQGPAVRGVLHGFAGTSSEAKSWMDLGLLIGIGIRAFTRNFSAELEQAIRSIPLDRLIIESDSSVRSWDSDENNQPARVVEVAERIAAMHGITPEEVGSRATENLKAMLKRR